jgi:hypothetical protein
MSAIIEAFKTVSISLLRAATPLLVLGAVAGATVPPANALSEIQSVEPDRSNATLPDAIKPLDPGPQEGIDPQEVTPDAGKAFSPEVSHDFEALPGPVQDMRRLIMEASRSGELEALRPLIGLGDSTTQLSLTRIDGDPIAHLKELSGDEGGQEILAILLEVLEAGYVHLDIGTDTEIYVWPYFFGVPIADLTPVQRVELFKIVTAGDYEDMLAFGGYLFYRVGITPDGRWQFFIAGD